MLPGFNSISSTSTRDLSAAVKHSDCLSAIPTAAAGSRLLAQLDLIPSQLQSQVQANSHTNSEAIMKSKTLVFHEAESDDAISTLTNNIPHTPMEPSITILVAESNPQRGDTFRMREAQIMKEHVNYETKNQSSEYPVQSTNDSIKK